MADYYKTLNQETGDERVVILFTDSKVETAESSHPRYEYILDALHNKESDEKIQELLHHTANEVSRRLIAVTDRISVSNGSVYVDGVETHDVITDHIIQKLESGDNDYLRVVKFYENLMQNPSEYAREQLFSWLQANDMLSLTVDGHVLGYKGVTSRITSVHSGQAYVDGKLFRGQIPYAIGAVATMPRNQVESDPKVSCAPGLHIGTYDYAVGWGSMVLEVTFNPRDAVSVPSHDTAKLRTCAFKAKDVSKSPYQGTSYYEDDQFDW